MTKRPVVLIVEDKKVEQAKASAVLAPYAELLIAGFQRAAYKLIESRPDIAYVILDGYVPMFERKSCGDDTTFDLAYEVLHTLPNAKIFSASSDNGLNDKIAEIGATRSNKQTAARLIRDEILKNS